MEIMKRRVEKRSHRRLKIIVFSKPKKILKNVCSLNTMKEYLALTKHKKKVIMEKEKLK